MRQRFLLVLALSLVLALAAVPATAFAAKSSAPVAPGGIVGIVSSAGGGMGIPGATVTAYQYSRSKGWQVKGSTLADAAGNYSISLPAGAYYVGFSATGFTGEFFDDAASLSTAQAISVAAGVSTPCNAALTSAFVMGGTNLTQTGTDVVVSWTSLPTSVLYRVWRAQDPAGEWTHVATVHESPWTDVSPSAGTYYYKVEIIGGSQFTEPAAITVVAN